MQTFITSPAWTCCEIHDVKPATEVCMETAAVLDGPRLGKQRVECKQIYTSLTTGKGWIHHPATKMWDGYLEALCVYGWYMCLEWRRRGFEDSLQDWFLENLLDTPADEVEWPWWFGHPEMVEAHRSKLIRKLRPYYETMTMDGGLWTDEQYAVSNDLPYIWPSGPHDLVPKGFYLSGAEYKRDDWDVPGHWHVTPNRRVTFA